MVSIAVQVVRGLDAVTAVQYDLPAADQSEVLPAPSHCPPGNLLFKQLFGIYRRTTNLLYFQEWLE